LFDAAVTNASPLIYLGRTGNLHLLQRCARTVSVPEAVVREIRAAGRECQIGSGLYLSDGIVADALALVGE